MRAVRRGWWRRNALALGVVALALAATVVVGFVIPYSDAQATVPKAVTVREGDSGRIGGATFELTKAGEFRNVAVSSIDVPKGSVILAVLVRIRTTEKLARGCAVSLVRNGTDKISWDPLDSPSDYGYGLSTSTEHACSLDDASGSRLLEQTFLVPRGEYPHVTLQIISGPTKGSAGERGTLRLELPAKPYSNADAG